MTAQKEALFWGAVAAGFLVFVFLFKAILLPFVLGMAIAYLLNPLVNALGRMKIGRGLAALVILFTFIIAVAGFFAAITPILYHEFTQFSEAFPGYIEKLWDLSEPFSKKVQALFNVESEDMKALAAQHAGTGLNVANKVFVSLAAGGQAILGMLSVVVITPVVAYFMMKEWNAITAWIEGLMPKDDKQTIKGLLKQIDEKVAGFIRGQLSVAFILALAYAVALTIAGLKYGFLIGMSAGLLSIIPMVGSAIGLIVSVLVAWFQSGEWSFVAIIAGIFLVGQFIEGNFLTPKLVGGSVGLHPLWVFFAIMAGGSLFGIVGMLLAVPVAAVVGVLMAFGIGRYKGSAYYKGDAKTKSSSAKDKKDA